jgi:hypothetical protein
MELDITNCCSFFYVNVLLLYLSNFKLLSVFTGGKSTLENTEGSMKNNFKVFGGNQMAYTG